MSEDLELDGIYYPIDRILANPDMFEFISEFLGPVPPEAVSEGFYELLEACIAEETDTGGMAFFATQGPNAERFYVFFENGQSMAMERSEGGIFSSPEEVGASFEVNSWIMGILREKLPPDWDGDFGLVRVPLPENNFLLDSETDGFTGEVYRLSNPEEKLSFTVTVLGEDEYDVKFGN